MPPSDKPDIPDDLDTLTCLALGQAFYRFLARLNDEADSDEFTWEDAGVMVSSGFIEIDTDTLATVSDLIDRHSPRTESGT